MRRFVYLLVFALIVAGFFWMRGAWDAGLGLQTGFSRHSGARLVSLSPAITEVITVLGEGQQLVGISDFCAAPSDSPPPRVGTSLSPNYEDLARLAPDMILTQQVRNAPIDAIGRIAPFQELPWLSVTELSNSIRRIGMTCGQPAAAEELATRIETTLDVRFPRGGPEVLFVLAHTPGQLSDVIYVRDDSIHGHALRAAGARNAQPATPTGVPQMSIEAVLSANPAGIVILSLHSASSAEAEALMADWRELTPLAAVQQDRIAVIDGRAFSTGPAILEVVDDLRATVESWTTGP